MLTPKIASSLEIQFQDASFDHRNHTDTDFEFLFPALYDSPYEAALTQFLTQSKSDKDAQDGWHFERFSFEEI